MQFSRFRSLESRIVALFLILILFVQLIGFFATQGGINENARASTREELVIGGRVFNRLLRQNADKLTQSATLLAADFGFLSAISSDDRETIVSSLENNAKRIGASHALLISADRQIKASTSEQPLPTLEKAILHLVEQVDPASKSGTAVGTAILGNSPYQVVIVPVKAPLVIGWVAMTFPIDQRLADDMKALSSLQLSILTRSANGDFLLGASTLSPSQASGLMQQMRVLPDMAEFLQLKIGENDYNARIQALAEEQDQKVLLVLQRSISEAVAPYRRLQINLLILTALGIAVAVIGSVFTARRITDPLRELSEIAKRLGTGIYEGKIAMKRNDEIGELSKAFESMRDGIASREVEIRRLAYWDTLTNLPNRLQFSSLLSAAIEQARREGGHCYILMMDLDRFKVVNDILGLSVGDALLRQLAERLKQQVHEGRDHVARLGGDEFAILLPNITLAEAQAAGARVLKSLELPMALEDQAVDLGAGIGIAGYPEHGSDAETLLSRAEVAMYVAKKSGNEAVVYDPRFDQSSQESLSLLSELRKAIDGNQFRLFVQPKNLLSTGAVVGVEALVRWVHPEKGMIFPDSFIPFSERTGFIRVLTAWMLDQSAAFCKELAAAGLHPKISVNLSTRDLMDQELPAQFAAILARHGVDSHSFCLEITESAIMDDPIRAQTTLENLNNMGFELAIDDFGTGYSSLAYLKRLPVDELKIDKSFVLKMETDADDAKIVQSTIDLGHNMGLRVIAEGIENEAVWELLASMGCDQGQGYFMSKPMAAEKFFDWHQHWTPPHCVAPAVHQIA